MTTAQMPNTRHGWRADAVAMLAVEKRFILGYPVCVELGLAERPAGVSYV
jgi:hypothetical protein